MLFIHCIDPNLKLRQRSRIFHLSHTARPSCREDRCTRQSMGRNARPRHRRTSSHKPDRTSRAGRALRVLLNPFSFFFFLILLQFVVRLLGTVTVLPVYSPCYTCRPSIPPCTRTVHPWPHTRPRCGSRTVSCSRYRNVRRGRLQIHTLVKHIVKRSGSGILDIAPKHTINFNYVLLWRFKFVFFAFFLCFRD